MNSGGTFDLNSETDTVGPVHIANGGSLHTVGVNTVSAGRLTTSNLWLESGSSLSMRIGPQGSSDQIVVNGTVQLGGTLHLSESAPIPIGTVVTLIDNNGPFAVVSPFDGLPQGAILAADNGDLFTISYTGSVGNDVLLVRRPNLMSTGVEVNDGAVQRSRITSLTIAFNAHVNFSITPGTAFTLVRKSDGAIVQFSANAVFNGDSTAVTLDNFGGNATQFGSLADGRYTLTALASQISLAGQPLDGNGDETAGDNFVFDDSAGLFRFFGDANGDQTVNGLDLGFFRNAFGSAAGDANYLSYLDFNGDGNINGFDLGQFRTRFGMMLP